MAEGMTQVELTHPKYRADIDGLRAIAVLSVVGFHAFPGWIPSGFIGVDIFFVISGFLISTIIFKSLARGEFSFRDFYARRIRRIFPALITVMSVAFAVGWFILYPDEYKQLGTHIFGGARFISNFVLLKESGYFDAAAETKPLLHLWSLGIEEQYYILFPLMVWAAWRRQLNLLTFTVLIGLASFLLNVHYVYKDPVWTFYQPQTRVWELMIGSVIALLMLDATGAVRKSEAWLERIGAKIIYQPGVELPAGWIVSNAKAWLGFALLVAGLWLTTKQAHFPGKWALLPTLGAALMIWAGPQAELNRQLLSKRVLVWVGKISFPLYLWHWVVLVYLGIVSSDFPSGTARCVAIMVAVVLSWLTYRFIEQPLRFGAHARQKTIGLVIAMVAVAALGFATYKSNGFNSLRLDGKDFLTSKLTAAKKNGPRELSAQGGYLCFQLPPDRRFDFFFTNKCIPPARAGNSGKSILLIGDSHSASLSLGLRPWAESRGFNYYQISSGACSLFSDDVQDTDCQQYSRRTFEMVQAIKPDILVIDSFWSHVEKNYFKNNAKWPTFIDYLSDRFSYISTLGAKKILLVGEVPSWTINLPDVLLKEFVTKGKLIPARTFAGMNQASLEMDARMRGLKYPPNFGYLSLKDVLCNAEGCRTSVGADWVQDVVAWDYGHLTASAARVVVDNALGPAILRGEPGALAGKPVK